MIHVIDHNLAPHNRPLLQSMFADRKRLFVDLFRWDVPVVDDQYEIDQFDNDHTIYLIAVEVCDRGCPKTNVGLGVGRGTLHGVQKGSFRWYISTMGNLTSDMVKELSAPGRYSDGGGLLLQISPAGGKSWLMRIQINGRRRDIGLGELRHVSLRNARLEAAAIKKLAAPTSPAAEPAGSGSSAG